MCELYHKLTLILYPHSQHFNRPYLSVYDLVLISFRTSASADTHCSSYHVHFIWPFQLLSALSFQLILQPHLLLTVK